MGGSGQSSWLLDRYLSLLRHEGWLETAPFDVHTPLPSYALVFDGHKLLHAKAYILANQNDAAAARELLTADVRFWRGVLASSDILITKMIAVTALNRTFGMGNLALRRLPAEQQLEAMPREWAMPVTDTERSMLRCFTGEWFFGDALLRQSVASGQRTDVVEFAGEPGFAGKLLGPLLVPLLQRQDVSNRRATILIRAAEAASVQLGPLGVQVSAVEPGAYRSEIDKNMLERLTEAEKANMIKVWGPPPDPMQFPEADEVAVAVAFSALAPAPQSSSGC